MTIQKSLLDFFSSFDRPFKKGTSFLVACSGGPDSVALVHSLKELGPFLPYKFHIGHINHKLRGKNSEGDARFTRELGAQVQWPFHSVVRPLHGTTGNLEEKARVQRYTALWKMARAWKCEGILTAHTSDDQIETIFLNMFRGTGPEGLGGIHPVRVWKGEKVPLMRPMLDISKQEVLKYLKKGRFKFRIDHTNRDESFSRNWVRRRLMPLIEKKMPGFKKRLSQTAVMIRDEQEVWEALLNTAQSSVVKPVSTGVLLDLKKLLRYPAATQRRLIRNIVGKDLATFEGVEGLRRWMQSPPTNGRFWQLRKGWLIERLSKSKGSSSAQIFWFKIQKGK